MQLMRRLKACRVMHPRAMCAGISRCEAAPAINVLIVVTAWDVVNFLDIIHLSPPDIFWRLFYYKTRPFITLIMQTGKFPLKDSKTRKSPAAVYKNPGTYDVTLTIKDAESQNTVVKNALL